MTAIQKDLRILVIEDNPGDFVLIEEYLTDVLNSPEITHSTTFKEAGDALKKNLLDVILLDLSLPDMSGESLVKNVVEIAGGIPIVVLTGYENQEFGLKTLGMGVADYLLKDEMSPFVLGKVIAYSMERNRIRQSLQASETKYRDIFNLSPQPMFLVDVENRTIADVNEAAVRQYGFSKQEFTGLHLKNIRPKETIPDFEEKITKIDNNTSGFFHSELKHQRKNGEVFDVELSTSDIYIEDKRMRMALAEDVTHKVKAEQNIRQKKNLLAANAKVTSALINNEDWMQALKKTFDTIGKALNVDRVYYFENHTDPETGKLYTSQKIEWVSEYATPQLNNSVLQDLNMEDFPEIFPKLMDNKIFQILTREVPQSDFRKMLEAQDILSILHFPIFIDDVFYGFIGFDDCTHERIWDEEELRYLETLGTNISGAIKLWKATQELERSERRFKALVQEGSDLIGILDKEFRFEYVSPSIGRDHKNYIGVKAEDLVHPDDAERVKKELYGIKSQKRVVIEPYRLRDNAGNYHWVETILTDLLDEPAVQGYVANSRNVSEHIRREEKLKELSLVASKTNDSVIITGPEGKISWVNDAFEKLTGYYADEIKGLKPGNFLQGEDTDPKTVERLSEAMRNKESIEETILNYSKFGESYWLDLRIDPIFDEEGNCKNFIAIERDVTDKIEQERELKKSLERLNIVNKATSDTIWDMDIIEDHMVYNSNLQTIFGYEQTEVDNVEAWWRDKIHPDDHKLVENELEKVLQSNTDRFQIEYRFKTADGSYKHIFDRAFIIKDETGKPVRMIGAMQDITHEIEEQEQLKLLESVVTNTNESVVITEAEPSELPGRKIIFVNEAFTELTGYDKEFAIGRTLSFLNGPKTDQEERLKLRAAMQKYEPAEAELLNYKNNGEEFWIKISMVPVTDNKGNYTHWVSIGRDVTEERKYQSRIRASLDEKETLLAEIHHRVKNNLAVVSGMMQLQAFDSENKELQTKLFDSVARIKTMATVHELLYQSNSFSQLEFSDTLKKLVENISETLQKDGEIELDINCEHIKLNINQAIPAALIVNEVLTNAYKHAFSDKKKGKIEFKVAEKDQLVCIEITDNGIGIPKNKLSEGGSLGLHLITALTGQINGTNEYVNFGDGTTFKLEFERYDDKSGTGSAKLS
ncbi:MAG: PAS domain S-box protein [Gracilimonas sp.]